MTTLRKPKRKLILKAREFAEEMAEGGSDD